MEKKNLIILVSAVAVIAAAAVLVSVVFDLDFNFGGGDKYDEITIESPYMVSASEYNANDGFRAADGSMLWVFDKSTGGKLEDSQTINLGVALGTDIPSVATDLIVDGAQAFTLNLAHVGEFPNKATLTYKVDSKYDGSSYTVYNVSGTSMNLLGTAIVYENNLTVNLHQSLDDTVFVFVQTPRVTFEPFIGGKVEGKIGVVEPVETFTVTKIVPYGTTITVNIVANEGYKLVSASYGDRNETFSAGSTTATFEITVSKDVTLTVIAEPTGGSSSAESEETS